ncbi:MAG: IS21 family transposase [Pseudomonadota bacterium]
MSLLNVIRRWSQREGLSQREIARRTGLSRNTVRKYLAQDTIDPVYKPRQSPSLLDDYKETLITWLHRERNRRRKERRTLKQLHADLVSLGFAGSYDRVAAFARQWRAEQQQPTRKSYIPLTFAPGEAFQFDWSEDWAVIAGVRCKLQIAHIRLCYSRAFFLVAYRGQSHEFLFDAHAQAFRAFGGVPERGIYDNMKTAVDALLRGKQRAVNRRFQAMTNHYVFEADFCNPAAGWEKGQVEKQVRDLRHDIWQEAPTFDSLADLNHWLTLRCQALWVQKQHPEKPITLAEGLAEEQRHLMPMPIPFDGYIELSKRVSATCLIQFERNRYSVPANFAHHVVSLHVYAERLVVLAEGHIIAEHTRVFLRHDNRVPAKTVYDWRHYLGVLQRKPGALRNGAPFAELPDCFRRLQAHLLKQPRGDREMADILALVLSHPQDLVEKAVEASLANGHPSHSQILNGLGRLQTPPTPKPLAKAPEVRTEPLASTAHFDQLREKADVY